MGYASAIRGTRRHMAESDAVTDAVVRLAVACRLAREALPNLPEETRQVVSDPIDALCEVADAALTREQRASE